MANYDDNVGTRLVTSLMTVHELPRSPHFVDTDGFFTKLLGFHGMLRLH